MNDARVEMAVVAVIAAAPELSPGAVTQAVLDAARTGRERNLLSQWLGAHPDALVSGDSGAPLVVGRLIDLLRVAGAAGLSKPRCAVCAEEKVLRHVVAGGRICTRCFGQSNRETCSRCGKSQVVATRDRAGAVCGTCNRKDPSTHHLCRACGELGPVATRDATGAVCQRCYQRPPRLCDSCGEVRPIHSNRSGRAICDDCYEQPAGRCVDCGLDGPLIRRGAEPGTGTCSRCYRAPEVVCVGCGETRRTAARTEDGPRCARCAPRPSATCTMCRRDRPVQLISADGPVCSTCYDVVHRSACRLCGVSCRPYERSTCARCVLRGRLDLVLAGPMSAALQPLRDALISAGRARSTLRWLDQASTVEVLSQLAAGSVPLSHQGLDTFSPSKPAEHIRGLLMASGVIELRDVYQDRLEPWLDAFLLSVERDHVPVVRAFAVWHVFRRVRAQAKRGKLTANGTKWARLRVRQAALFLRWLSDRGKGLEELTQADIDLWLASGPTTRFAARDFLRWAGQRRLAQSVQVPLRPVLSPTAPVEADARWSHVERLMHDANLDLVVRVAGLFALLFGQHMSRIVRLERGDVECADDGGVSVRFTTEQVVMPPVLDSLVRSLLESTGHSVLTTDRWLFPGGVPSQHLTAEQLRKRLATEAGVGLRSARNAALLHLAAELPAPVLADLLGLHENTAVAWIRSARGDWASYAATGAHAGRS